ncbi:hypothetical protein LguiB_021659 [Lonicera macranthoides]
MAMNEAGSDTNLGQTIRSESMRYTDMEKRQLFLRSYQFSRKKSLKERINGSFFRVKKAIWVRLRSAKKIRKIVWFKFRYYGLCYSSRRNRRFLCLQDKQHDEVI